MRRLPPNNAVNAPVLASRRLQGKRRATQPARYRERWPDRVNGVCEAMTTTAPPDNTRLLRLAGIWMVLVLSACTPTPTPEHHDARDEPSKATGSEEAMSQAEQDRRIDYVEFLTTNMEDTKRFYSGIFGWTFTDYGPDYASFNDGRLSGGFAVAPDVQSGGPLVVLYAVDLDALVTKVGEFGGRVTRETFDFPGGRRFHFADPSGNELAVWSDQ